MNLKSILLVLFVLGHTSHAQRFVKTVNTAADMVALPVGDIHTNVMLQGYNTVGDGGGGLFIYTRDVTTAANTNRALVLKPTTGIGRWTRQFSDEINVKWGGAKGNDVIEYAVIQEMVGLAASNNVPLFFPPGTYRLRNTTNSALTLYSNSKLRGIRGLSKLHIESPSVLSSNAGTTYGIVATMVTNVLLQDLVIYGNPINVNTPVAGNSATFFALTFNPPSSNVTVRGVEFYNVISGIGGGGSSTVMNWDFRIEDCWFHDIGTAWTGIDPTNTILNAVAIRTSPANNLQIVGNVIERLGSKLSDHGIYLSDSATNIIITRNKVLGPSVDVRAGHGVIISENWIYSTNGGAVNIGSTASDYNVIGNYLQASVEPCIKTVSGMIALNVIGNSMTHDTNGSLISFAPLINGVNVRGNYFRQMSTNGGNLGSIEVGSDTVTNLTIADNIFDIQSTDPVGSVIGVSAQAMNIDIVNNKIRVPNFNGVTCKAIAIGSSITSIVNVIGNMIYGGSSAQLIRNDSTSTNVFLADNTVRYGGHYGDREFWSLRYRQDTGTVGLETSPTMPNNTQFNWLDVGLSRESAGLLKVTDAAAGYRDIKARGMFTSGGTVNINAFGILSSPSDGVITLFNAAQNNFNRLQFGGTTALFPSIKRNATAIDLRLADDSNYAPLNVGTVISSSALVAAASSEIKWITRSAMNSPANGQISITDAAGTGFTRLNIGPPLITFPSLKVNGAGISIRLGDDSANSSLTASTLTSSALTSGRVPVVSTGGLLSDDAGLTYDSTTNHLAIGQSGDAYLSISGGGPRQLIIFNSGSPGSANSEYVSITKDSSSGRINVGQLGTGTSRVIELQSGGAPMFRGDSLYALVGPGVGIATTLEGTVASSGNPGVSVFTMESDAILTANNLIDTWKQYDITTTDATVTSIATIPITASRTYFFDWQTKARRTGGASGTADDGATYSRRMMVTTKAGVVTINGGVPQDDYTAEDQAGWDNTAGAGAAQIQIQVQGAAGNNVSWHTTVRISYVGQ